MWARKKLGDLVEKGLVEDRRVGNGFHMFRVSDNTQFNRINKAIADIDKYIDVMYEPIKQVRQLIAVPESRLLGQVYFAKFFVHYIEIVSTMIRTLFFISDVNMANQASIELHSKLLKLMEKHVKWFYDIKDSKEILTMCKNGLNKTKEELENGPNTPNSFYNLPMIKRLIKRLEEFERQFLN